VGRGAFYDEVERLIPTTIRNLNWLSKDKDIAPHIPDRQVNREDGNLQSGAFTFDKDSYRVHMPATDPHDETRSCDRSVLRRPAVQFRRLFWYFGILAGRDLCGAPPVRGEHVSTIALFVCALVVCRRDLLFLVLELHDPSRDIMGISNSDCGVHFCAELVSSGG